MKWLTLIALVMLTGCSPLQREADEEAARVADYVVPELLEDRLARADPQSPEERSDVAERWLSDPGPALTDSFGGVELEVRELEGTTIRVDVYQYWESGSFLPPDQGEAAWGFACRLYDVSESATATPVECPDGTPNQP